MSNLLNFLYIFSRNDNITEYNCYSNLILVWKYIPLKEMYRLGALSNTFAGLLLNVISKMYGKQTIENDKCLVRNKKIDTLF